MRPPPRVMDGTSPPTQWAAPMTSSRAADQPQPVLLQAWMSREAAVGLLRQGGTRLRGAQAPGARPNASGRSSSATHASASICRSRPSAWTVATSSPSFRARRILMKPSCSPHTGTPSGSASPIRQGRTIRPGANDDALGIAGVLELARAFAHAPRTQRTLVFAAWTAEERGLLGSETLAHPLYRPE